MSILTPKIETLNPTPENISRFKEIYFGAFPPEERRPWEQIERFLTCGHERFRAYAIMDNDNTLTGFITMWQLPGMNYIEHFAIAPSRRGNGTGENALRALMKAIPGNYILEVEPRETGETALRRIGFYSRLGFRLRDEFDYIQPAYADNLSPVSLTLMTTGDINPENAKNLIWNMVYGKKTVN